MQQLHAGHRVQCRRSSWSLHAVTLVLKRFSTKRALHCCKKRAEEINVFAAAEAFDGKFVQFYFQI
jgi:hypothetical protein